MDGSLTFRLAEPIAAPNENAKNHILMNVVKVFYAHLKKTSGARTF
jgi:hypothetical protein